MAKLRSRMKRQKSEEPEEEPEQLQEAEEKSKPMEEGPIPVRQTRKTSS